MRSKLILESVLVVAAVAVHVNVNMTEDQIVEHPDRYGAAVPHAT